MELTISLETMEVWAAALFIRACVQFAHFSTCKRYYIKRIGIHLNFIQTTKFFYIDLFGKRKRKDGIRCNDQGIQIKSCLKMKNEWKNKKLGRDKKK